MFTFIFEFLKNANVLELIEFLRKRNNRKIAANLNHALVYLYEIIKISEKLLQDLSKALKDYESTGFQINGALVQSVLSRQAGNLQRLEQLIDSSYYSIRTIDDDFYRAYKNLMPAKFGFFWTLSSLLEEGRLFLNEGDVDCFKHSKEKSYRTLWFSWERPTEDREEIKKYLYGWSGVDLNVIDINSNDGKEFFEQIKWYFETQNPIEKLEELKTLAESYRQALKDNFDITDLLSDIERDRLWL